MNYINNAEQTKNNSSMLFVITVSQKTVRQNTLTLCVTVCYHKLSKTTLSSVNCWQASTLNYPLGLAMLIANCSMRNNIEQVVHTTLTQSPESLIWRQHMVYSL